MTIMTRLAHPLRRLRFTSARDLPRETVDSAWRSAHRVAPGAGNFFHREGEKTRARAGHPPTPSPASRRLPGRLNLFQATMLDWRDLHPYNAVHAVRVMRSLDAGALAEAIEWQLSNAGLTGLELDRRRCRYGWQGGPAHIALESVDAGVEWRTALANAFERHLNLPFPRNGSLDPFRFFAMRVDEGFVLGIAYDHFIAGGDSIIALLDAIVARYRGDAPGTPALSLYPKRHARLFVRHPLRFVRGLARLPKLAASCRRTIRPRFRAIEDGHNGFRFVWLEAARYRALRDAAKRIGVTINDALMALLLLAQSATMPPRDPAKRRHELAVASIVNLRGEHGVDMRTFGQFLSSFRVSHPVPPEVTFERLAADVHRTTTRIKREKLFLVTLFAMAADRMIGRLQTPAQRMGIYAKNYPVGVGVSSLNVGRLWQGEGDNVAPMYMRGVPTGPLSPIVFAVTTSGDTMCLGISYRTSAVTGDEVDRLGRTLLQRIDSLK
ncbi:MAG TPA: hypothetical protein VJ891_18315 [Casimicrobiaceae bacterium]|nr:hypothetical protein [Casimicrobiaceae bacterium]